MISGIFSPIESVKAFGVFLFLLYRVRDRAYILVIERKKSARQRTDVTMCGTRARGLGEKPDFAKFVRWARYSF